MLFLRTRNEVVLLEGVLKRNPRRCLAWVTKSPIGLLGNVKISPRYLIPIGIK